MAAKQPGPRQNARYLGGRRQPDTGKAQRFYLRGADFAYAAGDRRISRKGSLFSTANDAGREEMERLVLRLQDRRFSIAETPAEKILPAEETTANMAEADTENVWRKQG